MGQGSSAEDDGLCCLGRDSAEPFKDPLTLKQAFHVDNVLSFINDEIDNLYNVYDTDDDDNIEWGKSITAMILSLTELGFEFGKRKKPELFPAASRQEARRNSDVQRYEKVAFKPILTKRVKSALFAELGEAFAEDGLSGDEFKQWMREQVFQKKKNLQVLFRHSKWCDRLVKASFDQADKDKDGKVSQAELGKFMEIVCEAIECPVPDEQELRIVEELAVHDPKKTGEGLHHEEFNTALINLLSVLYHDIFQNDMDQLDLPGNEIEIV